MRLLLSLACDDARVRADGKLDINGVFNELQAPGFPAVQDRMTVVFVMEWPASVEGQVQLRADLVDDDEQKVLSIQGHTDVHPSLGGHAPPQTRLIEPLQQVVFPHAGRYRFRMTAGGETVDAFELFVRERRKD